MRLLLPLLLIIGCSQTAPTATTCTVVKSATGVQITCPDGTEATISNGAAGSQGAAGPQGTAGSNGTNGSNGHDALAVVLSSADGGGLSCANGGVTILTGTDRNDDGLLEGSEVSSSADVCDGADAPPTSLTPVQAIAPCGVASSPYKEVLLVLSDGEVLASYSDSASGANTRLALLPDGSYVDTDASSCQFSLATNGDTRSITWSGGGVTFPFSN